MDVAQAFQLEIAERFKNKRNLDDSAIREHFDGSTVLVTGASGFIGKHLLENLIRSCNIGRAYVILRVKKGKTVKERLQSIIDDPIFDHMRDKGVQYAHKIKVVEGDLQNLRIGLSENDWKVICRETQYIFHAAATVNFTEHLTMATLVNVRGTREMVLLARECNRLRAFVHVSTAYSHATKDRIGKEVLDQFYPSPVPWDTMIDMAETFNEKMMEDVTPKLLSKWPNTYTFTKAISEGVIKDAAEYLPVSIIRPGIVLNSFKDPVPGWLDPTCMYGPSGLILGAGLGAIHVLLSSRSINIDIVPVDYVTNAIIAAGWHTARENTVKIYVLANSRCPVLWEDRLKVLNEVGSVKYITPKAKWYCKMYDTDNMFFYYFYNIVFHIIPSLFIDVCLALLGKPAVARKTYAKVGKLQKVISYFSTNPWRFRDDNTVALYQSLSDSDREIFDFDVANVDWYTHMLLWVIGVRKYLIKDGLTDTDLATKKQFWFKLLHYSLITFYIFVVWKLLGFILRSFC